MLVNGERALAYIVTIDSITPIDGADNIELAHVGGWNVIIRIGEFKQGDMAVFAEIDSLLPEAEWSEFLRPKKFRVKTYALNKFHVVSQGLLLPMDILPKNKKFNVGDDVTKVLGVTYYIKEDNYRKSKNGNPNAKYNNMAARHPKLAKKKWFRWLMKRNWGKRLLYVFLGRNSKDKEKQFPSWIKKTDEDRCLIGDTKIDTNAGKLRIADIVNKGLDVKVKSYNVDTGNIEYKPIVSRQRYNNNEELVEIEYPCHGNSFRKNRIVCTQDHKFFVNGEYVEAKDIHVGDSVYMPITCYGDDVIPIVYGMLLGDSSILNDRRSRTNNITISTTQGEKQLDYLKLKQSIFGVDNFSIYKGKSGYCDNAVYSGHIVSDVNIANHVLEDCYIDNKKTITKSMMDKITPLSLAFWYLDDGTLRHRAEDDSYSPTIQISTCGFSKEENEILIDMLWNKFGVESNLRREKDKYWSIYITTNGTKVFLELIKDYIPECMKYKTLVEYENLPCLLDNMSFTREEHLITIKVSNVKLYDGKRQHKSVYDIEVEDNHNFFANNVLVHNCENMPWMLEIKEPFVCTEKIDGTSTTVFLDTTTRKPDFGVCSRNVRQMDVDQENYHSGDCGINVYWEMAFKYNMKDALEDIAKKHNVKRVVLQGETYGEAVQGNPLHIKGRDFAAFNLIFDGERLGSLDAMRILDEYGIPFVPIIDETYIMPDDFEELKLQADGKSVISPKYRREGFVYRSLDGKQSAKNVSRDYLIRKKD